MIDEALLEQRLTKIEAAIADLQRRLADRVPSLNWLDAVTGSVTDHEAFRQALEFGREFRRADRPID